MADEKTPTCQCGRPLSQPYAQKLGMCIACKLRRIRSSSVSMRWTEERTIDRVKRNTRLKGAK